MFKYINSELLDDKQEVLGRRKRCVPTTSFLRKHSREDVDRTVINFTLTGKRGVGGWGETTTVHEV